MISKEEYWKLIEQVIKEQEDSDMEDFVDCNAWIPAEPAHKKSPPERYGSIDATKLKKEGVQQAIQKYQILNIGRFVLTIKLADKIKQEDKQEYLVSLYETKYVTPLGRPCNIQYRVALYKDTRFENRPWLKYFRTYGGSTAIPEATVLDIVRWLQAIIKLPAFL